MSYSISGIKGERVLPLGIHNIEAKESLELANSYRDILVLGKEVDIEGELKDSILEIVNKYRVFLPFDCIRLTVRESSVRI